MSSRIVLGKKEVKPGNREAEQVKRRRSGSARRHSALHLNGSAAKPKLVKERGTASISAIFCSKEFDLGILRRSVFILGGSRFRVSGVHVSLLQLSAVIVRGSRPISTETATFKVVRWGGRAAIIFESHSSFGALNDASEMFNWVNERGYASN
jgi:hypothetical protein